MRRFRRIATIGILLFLCIVFIPLLGVGVACRPLASVNPAKSRVTDDTGVANLEIKKIKDGLSGYARSEDQTYLILPEWYIVYSADEYAAFIAENPPSRFPYFRAIEQYWRGYYDVCAVTRGRYPFNSGYHLSLLVIGTSFTIENLLKGAYENTIGRITEWLSSGQLPEEDIYARQVAREYGDFIHTIPWYEFAFGAKLKGLWGGTSLWGRNVVRKWERKGALSIEYGGKSIYGWLIKQGTQTTYAPEDLEIQGWVEGLSDDVLRHEPRIRIVKLINARAAIVTLPRYEAFTGTVSKLVGQGVRFIEIAGNGEILVTAIAPLKWEYHLTDGELLFAMEILTHPDLKRIAVKAPVRALHRILPNLEKQGIKVEHVYDY